MKKKELSEQLEAIIDRMKRMTVSDTRSRIAYRSLEVKRKKLKRILYECDYCAEAIFKTDKNGDEQFVVDCGNDCPYHDYFMKLEEEKEERLRDSLEMFDMFG